MFASVEEVVIQLREMQKPFILMDSPERENEGDLVIPAELITKQWLNFMVTHCRGIVCVSIPNMLSTKLGLKQIERRGVDADMGLFFATTIEAKMGVSSGISAGERACTIKLLTEDNVTEDDFVTPGHVFPLIINDKGLSGRKGHTEGGASFVKLAGFKPIAVICEILDIEGDPAKVPYLMDFANKYDLKIGTIEGLENYLYERNIKLDLNAG